MLTPLFNIFQGCSELFNIDYSSSVPATVNYPVGGGQGGQRQGQGGKKFRGRGGKGKGMAARAK